MDNQNQIVAESQIAASGQTVWVGTLRTGSGGYPYRLEGANQEGNTVLQNISLMSMSMMDSGDGNPEHPFDTLLGNLVRITGRDEGNRVIMADRVESAN